MGEYTVDQDNFDYSGSEFDDENGDEDVDMAEIQDALHNVEKVKQGESLLSGRKRKHDELLSDECGDDKSNEENKSPRKKARRVVHNHARGRLRTGRKSADDGSSGNVVSKVVDKKRSPKKEKIVDDDDEVQIIKVVQSPKSRKKKKKKHEKKKSKDKKKKNDEDKDAMNQSAITNFF